MDAEGKSPPRPVAEPEEPRPRRRARNAAVPTETENAAVTVSMHPVAPLGTAAWRSVSGQLDHGPPDAIASSSASDVPSDAVGSTAAAPGAMVHVCVHCQKRFRSPGKLAQHARVHTSDIPFHCSVCPKGFSSQSKATRHERAHTSEKPSCRAETQ